MASVAVLTWADLVSSVAAVSVPVRGAVIAGRRATARDSHFARLLEPQPVPPVKVMEIGGSKHAVVNEYDAAYEVNTLRPWQVRQTILVVALCLGIKPGGLPCPVVRAEKIKPITDEEKAWAVAAIDEITATLSNDELGLVIDAVYGRNAPEDAVVDEGGIGGAAKNS